MKIKFALELYSINPLATLRADPRNFARSLNAAVKVFGNLSNIVYYKGRFYVLNDSEYRSVKSV